MFQEVNSLIAANAPMLCFLAVILVIIILCIIAAAVSNVAKDISTIVGKFNRIAIALEELVKLSKNKKSEE